MNDHVGKPFELDPLVALLLRLAGGGLAQRSTAPAPAPGAAPAPPEGMDLTAALERMGGDARIFGMAIHGLADDLGRFPAQLQAQLAQGDAPGAARSLHTLKGLAGTVGATPLAKGLAALEAELKGRSLPQAQDGAAAATAVVAELQRLVDATLRMLEPVLQRYPHQMPSPVAEPAALDAARLARDLHALCDLLQASDMAALAAHQRLQQAHAGALGAALAPLDAAMGVLDFEQALRLGRELLQTYGLAG